MRIVPTITLILLLHGAAAAGAEKPNILVIRADNQHTVVYLDTQAEEGPSALDVFVEEYQP